MSDYYIDQIFENEYPTKAASFATANNCRIETFEKVERTVDRIESRPGVRTGTYVVFTDGTEKSIVPDEIKIYGKGTKHMMSRLRIVKKPAPTLDQLKIEKLVQLEEAYLQWRNADAYLISSLGFPADSDERANTDVNAIIDELIKLPEESRGTVAFRGYDNNFYQLTLGQLQRLKYEIGRNGRYSYKQKWAYEDAIKNATSKEELDAIEIVFQPLDATKETE